jgi:hypothetical protein
MLTASPSNLHKLNYVTWHCSENENMDDFEKEKSVFSNLEMIT